MVRNDELNLCHFGAVNFVGEELLAGSDGIGGQINARFLSLIFPFVRLRRGMRFSIDLTTKNEMPPIGGISE